MLQDLTFDVIVCGSLHLDIVVTAGALPRIDETAVGSGWKKVCGGKGGNQAVQAARAGARTAMIGCVGKDDFGETLLSHLQASGVGTQSVAFDPTQGSGMSVAILQHDGDYGAVIVSGANTALHPDLVESQWQALGGAAVLVLQNEIPAAANLAAARIARRSNTRVVFNAAPARAALDDVLALTDVLVVNRVEAEALWGQPVPNITVAHAAIDALKSAARDVIITLGAEGLLVAPAGKAPFSIDPVPVKVVSTHGAGDCFVGVLAAALAKGADITSACRTANQQAAAFVAGRTAPMK